MLQSIYRAEYRKEIEELRYELKELNQVYIKAYLDILKE